MIKRAKFIRVQPQNNPDDFHAYLHESLRDRYFKKIYDSTKKRYDRIDREISSKHKR